MNNIFNSILIFGAQYLYLIVITIFSVWFSLQPRVRRKEILLLICICLPLIYIISKIASHLYYNPRPFALEHFKPLIPHKANNGFPSDHVLLVSAISAILYPFSRRLSIGLWGLTLFVGISRVFAGVHHLIDVIGAIFISISVVSLAYFIMRRRDVYKKK